MATMRLRKPDFATIEEMIVAAAEMVRPPERLTVSEAAAKYRFLDNAGSYVGKWLNEKTPYLVEPMDELTSTEFTGLIFAGPARTGKSDMFFNWLTHTAICDPADMMFIGMTRDVARDWSIGDLSKAFRHTKPLGDKLLPGRQNDNVHDKRFKSGMRLLIKWPVITEVSGKTLPRGWVADYDRIENADDVAKEGPLFDLLRKRMTTYKRFGMAVAESSPGREVTDPKWVARTKHQAPPTTGILSLYNRGDRRRWYWRCPHCEQAFEPDFDLLSYPTPKSDDLMEAAEMVTMRCPHCQMDIEPSMKNELNRAGRWVKDGQIWMPDGSMRGKPIRTDIASFWLKGPAAAFQDWQSLVFSYLQAEAAFEATQDEGPLKKTITTDQGKPYTPKAMISNRLPEEFKNRAEDWGGSADAPVIPDGVRFLVAAIDVQAGSRPTFVVHVFGIGVGGDVWHVDMFKIRKSERLDGDGERHLLDPAAYPEDWKLLVSQVIEKTYPLADGSERRMAIKSVACDSGGAAGVTPNAYNFWRWLRDEHEDGHHRRFQLIKGEPSRSAPRVRLSYPDTERKDRHSGARGDVPVLFINTNMMKDQVAAMLGRTDASEFTSAAGFGQVHYPIWAEDWLYTQLTAEIRDAKGWQNPRGKRNEAFDLLVYCMALSIYSPIKLEHIDWTNPPSWARDWDTNDLVIKPDANRPFSKKQPKTDLAELARQLA